MQKIQNRHEPRRSEMLVPDFPVEGQPVGDVRFALRQIEAARIRFRRKDVSEFFRAAHRCHHRPHQYYNDPSECIVGDFIPTAG